MSTVTTKTKAPDHTTDRIYWHTEPETGKVTGRAFVLCGYCPDTLDYFAALYWWALDRTVGGINLFPSDCMCGKIRKSSSIQGFTFISFQVSGPIREFLGFENYTSPIDFTF
jgi:hypothetical protein